MIKILFSRFILSCLLMLSNIVVGATGTPILVLADEKSFAPYTGEILRTEGFNEFQLKRIDDNDVSLPFLKQFDVVILTRIRVGNREAKLLTQYVMDGGCLIAFQPGKQLERLFGVAHTGEITDAKYLALRSDCEIGKGITSHTLQLHVNAEKYVLEGGEVIASLFQDVVTPTSFPAVVSFHYGKGHTIAFAYDLPKNISWTRQGNYRDAGREMDGIIGIRAMDLFTNGWVDASKNTLNQADEQMRLLSHCVETMASFTKPLPHFWYFPDTLKCLITLNNDGEDNKEIEFEKQFEDVEAKGAKMTLYVKEVDLVSKSWITKWNEKGFEMSGHPDDTKQATNPDWYTMDSVFKDLNDKLGRVYGIGPMRTVTNHWFVWNGIKENGIPDFSAQAQIEEQNGVQLDCNYAHYDNGAREAHFLGPFGINHGNYTGSGLPMKFANLDGDVINVYQHFNNVYDQQYMEHDDKEGFYNCFKGLVDRSIDDEVYSYVSVKAHNAEYFFSEQPLMKMLDYANENKIPVWTEEKLLNFLRAKDEAYFSNIEWTGSKLTFDLSSNISHSNDIACMIPYSFGNKQVHQVMLNDKVVPFIVRSVKGKDYTMGMINPGYSYRVEVDYL